MSQIENNPLPFGYPPRNKAYRGDEFLRQYTQWQAQHDSTLIPDYEHKRVKHRLMNNVIMRFAEPCITGFNGNSPIIIDGFAGLEGSLVAARKLEYEWVGINITHAFSQKLNTRLDPKRREWAITADFTDSPLETASADATIIAFGLNHMPDPNRGIHEAARITNSKGTIVIAEIGIPYEVTLAIVHQLAESLFYNQPYDKERILKLYETLPRNIKPDKFFSNMLYRQTGMNVDTHG